MHNCAHGPNVKIDGVLYPDITPSDVPSLIRKFSGKPDLPEIKALAFSLQIAYTKKMPQNYLFDNFATPFLNVVYF